MHRERHRDNVERLKRLILSLPTVILSKVRANRVANQSDARMCAHYTRPRNFIRDLSADDFYEARRGDFMRNAVAESAER